MPVNGGIYGKWSGHCRWRRSPVPGTQFVLGGAAAPPLDDLNHLRACALLSLRTCLWTVRHTTGQGRSSPRPQPSEDDYVALLLDPRDLPTSTQTYKADAMPPAAAALGDDAVHVIRKPVDVGFGDRPIPRQDAVVGNASTAARGRPDCVKVDPRSAATTSAARSTTSS